MSAAKCGVHVPDIASLIRATDRTDYTRIGIST
jgi:hypothetical protein